MTRKKKSGPPAARNPVAHHASKVNKAVVHKDRKKELKKTGHITRDVPPGDAPH